MDTFLVVDTKGLDQLGTCLYLESSSSSLLLSSNRDAMEWLPVSQAKYRGCFSHRQSYLDLQHIPAKIRTSASQFVVTAARSGVN